MIWCKIFGHSFKDVYLTQTLFVNSFCSRCGLYQTNILKPIQFKCQECGKKNTLGTEWLKWYRK